MNAEFLFCVSVRLRAAIVAVAACCVVAVPAQSADMRTIPEEKIFTANSDFFEFGAESSSVSSTAAGVARSVERFLASSAALRNNFLPPAGTRRRVEIYSQPGIFRFAFDDDGRVRVFLSGESDAAFPRLRRALAEALLLEVSPISENSPRAPAWLVSAIATESEIMHRPGMLLFLRKKASSASPVPLAELLSAPEEKFLKDENLRQNAFWFLRAALASQPNRMAAFLNPHSSVSDVLSAAFPQVFPGDGKAVPAADIFWAVKFFAAMKRVSAGTDSLAESQKKFDDALLFLVKIDGVEERVLASELIARRSELAVCELVSARLAGIAPDFRALNPVWHNAFTELGVFFEMFPNGEIDAGTLAAQWRKALVARRNALALQREILAALAGSPPEK